MDRHRAEATVSAVEEASGVSRSALHAAMSAGDEAMPALLAALPHTQTDPIVQALG